MKNRLKIIATITTTMLLLLAQNTQANLEQALLFEECGREYNTCQNNCVHIELIKTTPQTTPPTCDSKNNRIAQCRNNCYKKFTRCRKNR